jgi:hypothetical protein
MRIVMTLCVKDEADILDAQLAFHLHAGVDLVIVTDTGSTDGSLDILHRYASAGVLHLEHEAQADFQQSVAVTRMARRAAAEFGADWVINSDADEFWWPRSESMSDVLMALPARYGIVWGVWRAFLPRPDDGKPFYERMTVRLAPVAPIIDPAGAFRPGAKVAHRGDPTVEVGGGNGGLIDSPLTPLRGWYPFEVFHFPFRSGEQVERKLESNRLLWGPERHGYARRAGQFDRVEAFMAPYVLEDEDVTEGLSDGVLAVDTRLRDALRVLRTSTGEMITAPVEEPRLPFRRPTIVEDALFAVDVAALSDSDEVRIVRRLDEIELRQSALDRSIFLRLERRLRRLVKRGILWRR